MRMGHCGELHQQNWQQIIPCPIFNMIFNTFQRNEKKYCHSLYFFFPPTRAIYLLMKGIKLHIPARCSLISAKGDAVRLPAKKCPLHKVVPALDTHTLLRAEEEKEFPPHTGSTSVVEVLRNGAPDLRALSCSGVVVSVHHVQPYVCV